jgi:RNA polymerase sigma-70 factor (ECF subfamily)
MVPAFAVVDLAESQILQDDSVIESEVVAQATSWLNDNYGEFYNLRDVNADIVRVFENNSVTRYTVALSCETALKVKTVEELPFIKGLNSTLVGKSALSSSTERMAIDSYVSEIDAQIDEYRDLTVDVVVSIDKTDENAPWTMYDQDGMETTLYDIDVLSLDAKEMYASGRSAASTIISKYTPSIVARGYSLYNRTTASAYALKWVSSLNLTKCSDCGTNCGILQERSSWNNVSYPYFSLFMHNDCADFVSQAMSAGGLPESGTWFRTKKATTQDWGAAWTSVSSLKTWMTDSSRKYWDVSTYAACNAGNILLTSSSHVVMITLNDTVTHRYTGHTNDRRDYAFSDSSGYLYYTIKTT